MVAEVGVASGVFEEDRRLDALEGLARLDAQLVGHHRARLGVRLESLLGAVLAMQRSHQLTPEPLSRGVLARGRAQLVDRLGRLPEAEEQLEPLLRQADPKLVEPLDDGTGERHVLHAREHRPVPGTQRLFDRVQGLPGLVVARLLPGVVGQPLHLERVDVGGVDVQSEPVCGRLQSLAGTVGPNFLHEGVERARRRYQSTPEPGGHLIGRHRLARGQCEQRDQRPVALAGRGTEGAVDLDLHRSEQLDSHKRAA